MRTETKKEPGRALTTTEAASRLGVTPGRVRQLIVEGRLPATKIGRDLEIAEADLEHVRIRPWGRPIVREVRRLRVPSQRPTSS